MTGNTFFSERVVAKIVNEAAASVPAVARIDSSWAALGSKSYPRAELVIDNFNHTATIKSIIAVEWPAPALAVARRVQQTVSEWLEAFTGLRAIVTNVDVEQVVGGSNAITAEDLATEIAPPVQTVKEPEELVLAPVEVEDSIELKEVRVEQSR